MTVEMLLQPQRMARLVVFGGMGDYPNLEKVVDRIIEVTWGAPTPSNEYRMRVLHVAQRVVADQMMVQGSRAENPAEVRAILADRLGSLAGGLEGQTGASPHARPVAADIRRWERRPESTVLNPPLQVAPGDPIGGGNSRN